MRKKYDYDPSIAWGGWFINWVVRIFIKPRWTVWYINRLLGFLPWVKPTRRHLERSKISIEGYEGGKVNLFIYRPHKRKKDEPALIYFHGGGFYIAAQPHHFDFAMDYATQLDCPCIFVDYRLALEHPYPVGVEDCYAALEYIYQEAEALGIDPKRIAIGGDSAGGALCAAVAQMARDRGGPEVCCQMLIYPATDNRADSNSAITCETTLIFDAEHNRTMWEIYLKNHNGGDISPYAAPSRANSFKNLPPMYVATAEYDPLRDEGIDYARKLQEAGVEVVLHQTQKTFHGYDLFKKSAVSQKEMKKRYAFLKRHLHRESAA